MLFYFKAEQQGSCESALMPGRHLCAGRYEIKQGRGYRVATRHQGGLSFPGFSLAAQRKANRLLAKPNVKKL